MGPGNSDFQNADAGTRRVSVMEYCNIEHDSTTACNDAVSLVSRLDIIHTLNDLLIFLIL